MPEIDAKSQAEAHRNRAAKRSREQFASVSDIGDLPPVKNPKRRKSCEQSLFKFLTTYFPNSTGLKPFSDDHKRIIERIELCILDGGRFVNAVYRGFAKTTIAENAVIWATGYGHRKYAGIFGAGQREADMNIESIKTELSENELLLEDFPEICVAIQALEGKPQRCSAQTYKGNLTHIAWVDDTIILPTIPGSLASGAVIMTRGITGGARGMGIKSVDGKRLRPDFILIDDPQTDASAASVNQVRKRLNTISKGIMRLGGHSGTIACVMNATVIQPDDLVDQLLDQKKNPAWQSERIKMLPKLAKAHETLWLTDYADIRRAYDPNKTGDQKRAWKAGTSYYRKHRKAMDAGATVSWKHCYDATLEISAIQHAYNILIDEGEEHFASECQNEPLRDDGGAGADAITSKDLVAKASGVARDIVPAECSYMTAFCDVQKEALFYVIVAWGNDLTGHVVRYGAWPEQKQTYWTLRDVKHTLAKKYPGKGLEGTLYAGLDDVAELVLGRAWQREDGSELHVSRMLVDANWSQTTKLVRAWCRRNHHASRTMPAHGRFFSVTSRGINDAKRAKGEITGHYWRVKPIEAQRHVIFDLSVWKSWINARFGMALGDKGTMTLYGKPAEHAMFADQITSEFPQAAESQGRKMTVWTLRPGRDNHWLDCMVGSAVAASMGGLSPVPRRARKTPAVEAHLSKPDNKPATPPGRQPRRQKVSYL